MKNEGRQPNRRQFSLLSMLLVVGVFGVGFGLWTWLSDTIPGGLAAVVILCWASGLLLLASTSTVKFDDDWRHGVVQLLVGIGCGTILVGPLIAVVVWSLWNWGK